MRPTPAARRLDLAAAWYVAQCDDEWEHGHGITIDTLDNPGWSVTIELTDTALADREYARKEVYRSENDWCVTWVKARKFQAACGPTNLAEPLNELRRWACH